MRTRGGPLADENRADEDRADEGPIPAATHAARYLTGPAIVPDAGVRVRGRPGKSARGGRVSAFVATTARRTGNGARRRIARSVPVRIASGRRIVARPAPGSVPTGHRVQIGRSARSSGPFLTAVRLPGDRGSTAPVRSRHAPALNQVSRI